MLELHVADTNVTNGSIKVSWCLSKEALMKMADRDLKDPYIVFCVSPYGEKYSSNKESRTAVPLKDMIAYLSFDTSGPNRVWAWLASTKKIAHRYLQKSYGSYDFDVLNNNGTDYRTWNLYDMCLFGPEYLPSFDKDYQVDNVDISSTDNGQFENEESSYGFENEESSYGAERIIDYSATSLARPIDVYIPRECFAPEPSQWEKVWVNCFFENKCVNQCDFRRRRLFAYTLQPLIMVVNLCLRFLIFIFALLFGARNLSLEYLLHPLTYSFLDSFQMFFGGTIFVLRTKYNFINFLPLIFMPYIFAILFIFYEAKILFLFPALAAVVACAINFYEVKSYLEEFFANKITKISSKRNLQPWYLDENEQNLILCNGQTKPVKLSALPRHHRTVKLRFYDLKSKICRPFSK